MIGMGAIPTVDTPKKEEFNGKSYFEILNMQDEIKVHMTPYILLILRLLGNVVRIVR